MEYPVISCAQCGSTSLKRHPKSFDWALCEHCGSTVVIREPQPVTKTVIKTVQQPARRRTSNQFKGGPKGMLGMVSAILGAIGIMYCVTEDNYTYFLLFCGLICVSIALLMMVNKPK
ncbi:hypothetical protein LX64_02612 [Chitinophaga skermanii]|uniref:Uncharacterized protein n=1 Tax=Chitinophaga skermanii TaxID=331697 RepID=A0A327QP26_9BACT|nr:hypothetical protein LX64_02612 [Chitinophaga skermanii]